MSERKPKVMVVVSHPIQYFAPLYRKIAANGDVDLVVAYFSRHGLKATLDREFGVAFSWDGDLLAGYRHVFVPNLRGERSPAGFFSLANLAIVRTLWQERPDVVLVNGYAYAGTVLTALAARLLGMATLLRGESQLLQRRVAWKRLVKRVLLAPFLRGFSGVTPIGALNRAYYQHYGVAEDRMFMAPYVVDDAHFAPAVAAREIARRREAARQRFGIPAERTVIGFAGKLIAKKRPELLAAAGALLAERHDVHLLFAGEGELRGELERRATGALAGRLSISGFLNQAEMLDGYAAMDVFALPSSFEPWGLVVNEALACGLPVVVSDQVGSAPDLVRPAFGRIVAEGTPAAWAAALETFVRDAGERAAAAAAAREHMRGFGIDQAAAGLTRAILAVAARKRS